MRYMMLTTASSECRLSKWELLEKMAKFMADSQQTGERIAADWTPTSSVARVRLFAGRVTVMDGPLTETKRPATCAMFDVESLDEAVEWTASYLRVLGEGECEIRPVFEASDFQPLN